MKKHLINVLTVLLLAVLLISCSQDGGSGSGNDEVNPFSAGWWKQTTTSGTKSVSQYFLFDEDKVLIRCGSDSYEFTGTQFDNVKQVNTWDFMYKNQGTYTTFTKLTDDAELPEWISQETEDNNEEKVEEAVYADDFFDKDNIKLIEPYKRYYYSDNFNEKDKIFSIYSLWAFENQSDVQKWTTYEIFYCDKQSIMLKKKLSSDICFHAYYYSDNSEKKEFWFRVKYLEPSPYD
ncbi:MAG: hypothetical protein ACI4JN_07530 [Ruminococcus sp.]